MRRAAGLALAAAMLVPASAGAGTARPPVALTVTPARVALAGSGQAAVRVTNAGLSPLVVDVARAGFALDLRGRPKVVARAGPRASASWLTVRPGRFVLGPGAGRSLTVASRLPARVEPGDHDALVLLTTRPQRGAGVAVRMRIGIVVVVRAPGPVVRRLELRGLRVRRGRGARILELGVVNRGNVTETLDRGWVRISLRRGAAEATLSADPRELRPRTRGVVQLPYRGRLRGWVTVRVRMAAQGGCRSCGEPTGSGCETPRPSPARAPGAAWARRVGAGAPLRPAAVAGRGEHVLGLTQPRTNALDLLEVDQLARFHSSEHRVELCVDFEQPGDQCFVLGAGHTDLSGVRNGPAERLATLAGRGTREESTAEMQIDLLGQAMIEVTEDAADAVIAELDALGAADAIQRTCSRPPHADGHERERHRHLAGSRSCAECRQLPSRDPGRPRLASPLSRSVAPHLQASLVGVRRRRGTGVLELHGHV